MARLAALEELPGKSNFFIGRDPAKWRTSIWEADSHEQMCAKLFKSLVNANRYINRHRRELKATQAFVSQIQVLVAHLGKCENRLGSEARETLEQLAIVIDGTKKKLRRSTWESLTVNVR